MHGSRGIHTHARPAKLRDDAVVNPRRRVVAYLQAAVGRRVRAGANPGAVVDLEVADGRGGARDRAIDLAVQLRSIVLGPALLNDHPELVRTPVAHVRVEAVVIAEGRHAVTGVDRAAEELEAVVPNGIALDVVDGGTPAHAAHGQAVDFLVRQNVDAAVADGDVAHRARAVVVVIPAETIDPLSTDDVVGQTFVHFIDGTVGSAKEVGGHVERGITEEHDAAPQTAGVNAQVARIEHVVLLGGKDNRVLRGAVGEEFRAAGDVESGGVVGAAGFAFDDGAGLNVKDAAREDI